MDGSITPRPKPLEQPFVGTHYIIWTIIRVILGAQHRAVEFIDFGSIFWNSGHFGVKNAGKCMDGSITSRPEPQALPLFRAPNNFLDHFRGYFGPAAQFGDVVILGPKRPNLGIWGGTFW